MADPVKNAFMLSSATVMVAPYGGTPVFDLQPSTHSVGLVKEVGVNVDSSSINLMNGVAQALVDSRKTGVSGTISCNVHEFTAQNFIYAQGLGTTPVQIKRGVLTANVAAAATSATLNSSPIPGESASAISVLGDIPSGSTIIFQDQTNPDKVFPTRTSAATTGTGPFTITFVGNYAMPTGVSFVTGDYVWIVNEVGVADTTADNLVALKLVGTLASFNRPVVVVFPKVRVTKGFQLSFTESEYGSMPWELSPMLLTTSEATGRLADIGSKRPGVVYAG